MAQFFFLSFDKITGVDIHAQDIEGLLLAALLGAIIGLDREYRGKPAGFRTLMLVSMGAALFATVSFRMALKDPNGDSDVTRIASNIVVGIGFLGAGIIFRNGQDVKGLTTAATIWMAAAIGIACGIGTFTLAVVSTVITWITLFVLHYIERTAEQYSITERYKITAQIEDGLLISSDDYFETKSHSIKERKISKKGDSIIIEWTIRASRATHEAVIDKMVRDPRIVDLEH